MAETGRDKFNRYKGIINTLVLIIKIFPHGFHYFLLSFFRNTNGAFGLVIRYVLVKILAKSCGDNVSIQPGVYLYNLQNISLGSNVSIHPMCYIDGAGSIAIGNNVSIAHGSSILSANHTWEDITVPIKYNKQSLGSVVIESDVWIGCGCRILVNVNLGSRSVVAAGAVVNKSVKANSVVGGVPARHLKVI